MIADPDQVPRRLPEVSAIAGGLAELWQKFQLGMLGLYIILKLYASGRWATDGRSARCDYGLFRHRDIHDMRGVTMIWLSLRCLALAGLLSGLAAPATVAQAPVSLKFSHQSSTSHPFHVAATRFAETLSAATQGRVEVRVFPTAQLGGAQQATEGLLLGNVDITPAGTPLLASFVPELNVVNMPFLFRDAAHFDKTFAKDSPVAKELSAQLAGRGFRWLGMFSAGERHFMTKRPIRTMQDMKGLKFRSIENQAYIAAFSAFGANPVAIAYPELYGALQTGVVDGADGANTNYFVEKFYEVAPNWAIVNWLTFSNPLVMSERKFRSLSAADQATLLAVADEVCRFERDFWARSDDEKLPEIKAKGVQVTVLDAAPFREASKPVYERFLKTDREKAMLKLIQDVQ